MSYKTDAYTKTHSCCMHDMFALPNGMICANCCCQGLTASWQDGHLTLRHCCRCDTNFVVVCRLSRPAVFKHALLAKHGPLVVLLEVKLRLSSEELAAYLQDRVEAVTGRSLEEYRQTPG